MSFPRAKLQRFNECASEAPPPGAYDPNFEGKIKGLAIEKSERFQESKSTTSSVVECNVSTSSKGVFTPTFRTPQVPRKRVIVKPSNLSCPKGKFKSMIVASKYNSKNEVADLKVECQNKNKTILEYEKQIDEIKNINKNLEERLEELNKKQVEFVDQHRKDLEAMAKLQQDVLNSQDEKNKAELETLQLQLAEATKENEQITQLRMELQNKLENRVATLVEKIANLEAKLKDKQEMEKAMKHLHDLKVESEKKQDKLIEEINELRESQELVLADVTKLKEEKEKQLCDFEEEMRQLGLKNEELQTSLVELGKNHYTEVTALNNDISKLKSDLDRSLEIRHDFEAKLENRQQLVLELQSLLSTLECELDEYKGEQERLVTENKQEIADLIAKHEDEITELKNNFENQRKKLETECQDERTCRLELERKVKECSELNEFLTQELQEVQVIYKTTRNRLEKIEEELKSVNEQHSETLKSHSEESKVLETLHFKEQSRLKQLLEDARQKYMTELEKMTVALNDQITKMKETSTKEIANIKEREKERADKIIKNAEAVTRETLAACRAESEERVKRAIAESNEKINATIEEMKSVTQEDMRLAAERSEALLRYVEADRTTLKDSLAQKEMEIERLSIVLDELKNSVDIQESLNQSLQAELDQTEAELANKKEELRSLKDQICAEAAEMVTRKRRLEVVMAENQASVEALSRRILQSDVEIERLQRELECGEVCINKYRDLLAAMRNSSKLVYEQMNVLMDQFDTKNDAINKLQIENTAEMNAFKSCFDAKLESFKELTSAEVTRLQDKYNRIVKYNEELKQQLSEMNGRLAEARVMLLKLEERNDAQVLEISKLQLTKEKVEQQLKNLSKVAEERNAQHEARSIQYKLSLNETNQNIMDLSMRIKEIKENQNCSKEEIAMHEQERLSWQNLEVALIKELEMEKERREKAEEELEQLSKSYKSLKRDSEEMAKKYAELLGHQNQKQKIKHISQLKDEILRLKEDLKLKTNMIEQQAKTIERLKSEEKRSFTKGKENLQISKNASSTPVSSPLKPVTPLRDRNE